MIFDELGGMFLELWRRVGSCLLAEFRHQFVFIRPRHFHFFEVGSVGLDFCRLTGSGENGVFGEIWEDQHECAFILAGRFKGEASGFDLDGVHTFHHSVGAVNI